MHLFSEQLACKTSSHLHLKIALTILLAETETRYTKSVTEDDLTSLVIGFPYNLHFAVLELNMAALEPSLEIHSWVHAALVGPVTRMSKIYERKRRLLNAYLFLNRDNPNQSNHLIK